MHFRVFATSGHQDEFLAERFERQILARFFLRDTGQQQVKLITLQGLHQHVAGGDGDGKIQHRIISLDLCDGLR